MAYLQLYLRQKLTTAWEQRKLGEIFRERKDRSANGELLSVTINTGIVKFNSLERKNNSSADKSNYKIVKKNDIAYNSMRMWQGASGVSYYDGIVSPAYTVIIPNVDMVSRFFGYQFKQVKMLQVFQKNSQGLTSDTWNLKFPALKSIKVTIPEKNEQTCIVDLLNLLDSHIAANEDKQKIAFKFKRRFLQSISIYYLLFI